MSITFSKLGNYGRLGNQLFQYATLCSVGLKNDRKIVLPYDTEHRLSLFEAPEERGIIESTTTYQEPNFHFNENIFDSPDECDFLGYFQSEKYFLEFKEEIKKALIFRDPRIRNYANKYLDRIRKQYKCDIVALHNRRGDNVPSIEVFQDKKEGVFRPDKNKFHPLLDIEYIASAMGEFKDVVFLVFSDTSADINWCKENIQGQNVIFSENHPDFIDFALQQMCDHNIIANSSFSWWAAWLNNNPNKKIIAPKRWFGDAYKHFDLKDLYPEDWIIK